MTRRKARGPRALRQWIRELGQAIPDEPAVRRLERIALNDDEVRKLVKGFIRKNRPQGGEAADRHRFRLVTFDARIERAIETIGGDAVQAQLEREVELRGHIDNEPLEFRRQIQALGWLLFKACVFYGYEPVPKPTDIDAVKKCVETIAPEILDEAERLTSDDRYDVVRRILLAVSDYEMTSKKMRVIAAKRRAVHGPL
jgi:hypothetical protein